MKIEIANRSRGNEIFVCRLRCSSVALSLQTAEQKSTRKLRCCKTFLGRDKVMMCREGDV